LGQIFLLQDRVKLWNSVSTVLNVRVP